MIYCNDLTVHYRMALWRVCGKSKTPYTVRHLYSCYSDWVVRRYLRQQRFPEVSVTLHVDDCDVGVGYIERFVLLKKKERIVQGSVLVQSSFFFSLSEQLKKYLGENSWTAYLIDSLLDSGSNVIKFGEFVCIFSSQIKQQSIFEFTTTQICESDILHSNSGSCALEHQAGESRRTEDNLSETKFKYSLSVRDHKNLVIHELHIVNISM